MFYLRSDIRSFYWLNLRSRRDS